MDRRLHLDPLLSANAPSPRVLEIRGKGIQEDKELTTVAEQLR